MLIPNASQHHPASAGADPNRSVRALTPLGMNYPPTRLPSPRNASSLQFMLNLSLPDTTSIHQFLDSQQCRQHPLTLLFPHAHAAHPAPADNRPHARPHPSAPQAAPLYAQAQPLPHANPTTTINPPSILHPPSNPSTASNPPSPS